MDRPRTSRRRPDTSGFAPTSLTEITRRYVATALALSKAMGLPMTKTFIRQHRESITTCFIEAGKVGVRLAPTVQLPPLSAPGQALTADPVATATGQPEAGDITGSGLSPAPEEPPSNGHTPPTVIPKDAGLPCGGVAIAALKPVQLAMVLNKVATLVHAEGERWIGLLSALQIERGHRLENGRKPRREG